MSPSRFATWFLLLASTMTILASATLAPALPAMSEAFAALPHAEFWVKMTVTLPGIVIALCAPLAGMLVDKWNNQKVLQNALLAFALSGGLGFYWHDSLWLILFSRALMGVAVAFIMVSCTTIAGRYFAGPQFSRYMGWQAAFGGFGGVLFLALAGLLVELHWTWVFAIYGLALLVWPGVWRCVTMPAAEATPHTQPVPSGLGVNKALVGFCALAFVEISVLYGLTIQLPFYLRAYEATAATIGLVIAGFLLAMSCISLCYGFFRRHMSIERLHLLGWLVIAVGFVLLSYASSIFAISAASLVIGAGLGAVRPNLVVWLFEFVPPSMRGKAMGVMMTCYFGGQFVSPLVLEPLTSTLGYTLFFLWFAAAILIITLLVAGVYSLKRTKQLRTKQQRTKRLTKVV